MEQRERERMKRREKERGMHVAREADRIVGSTRKMDSMEEGRGIERERKRVISREGEKHEMHER